jgi:chemotaxis protein CheD
LEFVYLLPGALFCTHRPSVVSTVLGSCVALCLWDCRQRIAGINHYVLPYYGDEEPSLRYGDFSIAQLLEAMRRLGGRIEDIEAKIFGGAAVIPVAAIEGSVGDKNVRLALEYMEAKGIPVVARRSGGRRGLLIRMSTRTGEVLVRQIPPTQTFEKYVK